MQKSRGWKGYWSGRSIATYDAKSYGIVINDVFFMMNTILSDKGTFTAETG
ncbi:hypothetical protein [Escherichia coli]|uniref:hypothetical protein n=1 Tax=Escherichia coli TaxID=562 RepID=UPI00388DC5CC